MVAAEIAIAMALCPALVAAAVATRADVVVTSRLPAAPAFAPASSNGIRGRRARAVLQPLSELPFLRIGEYRRRRRRLRAIDRELPLLLDALASAAAAGVPPRSALERAASIVEGPLAEELRGTLDAVALGARWRDRLEALTTRVPLRDLSRAVAVMTRTDVVGASFADTMTTLAVRARAARRAELAQRARTAPVKMLFPLVFLVLPAFLLLTVVPLLVATLDPIS